MGKILRPYQQAAVDAVFDYFAQKRGYAPLVVAPVGAGKSLIHAEIIRRIHEHMPRTRIVSLTHVKELLTQNAEELRLQYPNADFGFYCSGLGQKRLHNDITFASVQSIHNKAHLFNRAPQVILVDECFVGETLVETANGSKRIDGISIGEIVYNATGKGEVVAISKKRANVTYKVRLSNEQEIRVTPNHPFLSKYGWITAGKLEVGTELFGLQDMPVLWQALSTTKIPHKEKRESGGMAARNKHICQEKILLNILLKEDGECHVGSRSKRKNAGYIKKNRAQAVASWWEWERVNRTTKGILGNAKEWMGGRGGYPYKVPASFETVSNMLQGRHRKQGNESCDRTGWEHSLREKKRTGFQEGLITTSVRVESIKIEESESPRYVYNLQVNGHPSYFAGGVLVHNCHLISHNDGTTYRRFINKCLELNPNLVVIGLTGSPFRADTGRLDEGDGRLFTGIAYEIEINWMIEQGYLCKPVTPQVSTKMDISGVQTRGGDYVAGQLEKAVDVDATTQACVREIVHHGQNRNKVLIFTAGVQHCQHVRDAIRALGHQAEMVTGETEPSERADTLRRYKHGEFKYLVNVAVLTTGYNEPSIDMLAFMRPTKSPVLYLQTTGRGIRTVYAPGYDLETQQGRLDAIAASGKPDCLLLDFGDVVKTLGPIDTLDIRKQPKKQVEREPGEAITKRCPSCGTVCAASQRYCYNCSYSFIDASLSDKASKAAVVSADQAPEEYAVIDMELSQHRKKDNPDAPPTLKVTYTTLAGPFSEYICFEHHTYPPGDPKRFAWDKAVAWHKARKPNDKPPTSVEDAIFMLYPNPSHVTVKREGKYWRVLSCRFDHEKVTAMERPDLQLEREVAERNIMFENEGLTDSIPF